MLPATIHIPLSPHDLIVIRKNLPEYGHSPRMPFRSLGDKIHNSKAVHPQVTAYLKSNFPIKLETIAPFPGRPAKPFLLALKALEPTATARNPAGKPAILLTA